MNQIKRMAWGVINAIQLLITLFWTAPLISLALLIRAVTGNPNVPLRMAGWCWAPLLVTGALARLEVSGREHIDPDGPAIYIANHQSMIDVCALFMALPIPLRFMLKAELARIPFLGWYTRAMGMILVHRGHPGHIRRRLAEAAEMLRNGQSLAAFPEGTRSRDGSIGRFKHGVFQAAINAGVPVVPIAITGSGRVMPPGGFRIRPGRIRVKVGRPIETRQLDPKDRIALAEQARRAIERLQTSTLL